ncbi:unnamed protein product, partial [marine sediment metagenome]
MRANLEPEKSARIQRRPGAQIRPKIRPKIETVWALPTTQDRNSLGTPDDQIQRRPGAQIRPKIETV